jgi:hypothetical protein
MVRDYTTLCQFQIKKIIGLSIQPQLLGFGSFFTSSTAQFHYGGSKYFTF